MTGASTDNGGFYGYEIQSIDLGQSLLVAAFFSFIFAYGFALPCLVYLGDRYEALQQATEMTALFADDSSGDVINDKTDHTQVVVETTRFDGDKDAIQSNNHSHNCRHEDVEVSSVASSGSQKSSSTIVSALADLVSHARSKGQRRRRRARDNHIDEAKRTAGQSAFFHVNKTNPTVYSTLLQGIHPGTSKSVDPSMTTAAGATPEVPHPTAPPTVPTTMKYAEDFTSLGVLDKIAMLGAYDIETRRIIRLAAPFCTQAFITGLTNILTVSVIGKMIGTREVSAYVIVLMWVELSSEFVGGLHEALATLCSQAIGARNKPLAGSYVQIVVILYTLCFIPFCIIWIVYMGDILRWHEMDEETVQIGVQYTYILVSHKVVDGWEECVHGLLDVSGHEKWSTLVGGTQEVMALVIAFFWALFGSPDLNTIGLIQFAMCFIFTSLNIAVIHYKGWFRPYYPGMFGSFALTNGKAVWLVCKTGSSLAFGMLLTDGEWEVLTICAQMLGPAEVVAWGILGNIWNGAHELIDSIADASEVRVAFLMGSGDPDRARVSAYKSMMIGTYAALYITTLLYMAGDSLPTWFTTDPTLQHILKDILPMFGLASLVMAMDTVSWTIVGAQGRYRLATVIVCIVSWTVTIPLAVLFSVVWNVDLNGQLTGFTLGYIVMGVTHSYFLFRSNWYELSKEVMEEHDDDSESLDVAITGTKDERPSLTTDST